MTPPDPPLTAPPTVAPASDEAIAAWREISAGGRRFIPADVVDRLIARIESDHAEMAEDAALIVRRNATIAKQAEEIAGLSARVAELEAKSLAWRRVHDKACDEIVQLRAMVSQETKQAFIKPTHEVADAFWRYWRENGETHKHGYYESTWGAINAALRAALKPEPAKEKP